MSTRREPLARRYRDYRPECVVARREAREAHRVWLQAERRRLGDSCNAAHEVLRPFWAQTVYPELEKEAKYGPIVVPDDVLAPRILAAAAQIRLWPGELFVRRVVTPVMDDPRTHLPPGISGFNSVQSGLKSFDYSYMTRFGDGIEAGGRLFARAFDGAVEKDVLSELREWSAVLGDWPGKGAIRPQDTRVGIYYFFMTLEEWVDVEYITAIRRIDGEVLRLGNRQIDVSTPSFWQSPGNLRRAIEELSREHKPSEVLSMSEIERRFLIPMHRLVKWATKDEVRVRAVDRKQRVFVGSLISKLTQILAETGEPRLPDPDGQLAIIAGK